MLIFDIETGPLSEETIIGQFDPDAVKLGQMKDEAKIKAKIEAARKSFLDKAALSPLTGRVLAIGYVADDNSKHDLDCVGVGKESSEADILRRFWCDFAITAESYVGFNINGFDLPFIARRSWLLGVDVPEKAKSGRYWSPRFVDLLDIWRCGDRQEYVGLDVIDKALGRPGKPKGTTGADFARLFFGTKKQKKQALDYLINDLEMTRRVAEALQVL